ncbi:MFS transporter [Kitasatospora aureofaciens]|uniref:MFS transporter n=1 Tax=Kitasatospora aureofaciens TaxID=1894 RepID=UPI0033F190A2
MLTWIADGYTVALAALVLPLGALGDRVGRRKVLIVGNVVFGAAAVLAACSSSTPNLIVCRVVMGLGAAVIMPGTLSTVTAVLPEDRKDRGVAIWSGFAAAGAIIDMLAAGGLLEQSSRKSIFWTSAATAMVCALAALLLAPETRSSVEERFDFPGSATTALAVGALVYGIIEGNGRGWTRPEVLAAFAVAVVALAAYAVLGLRSRHPLLDPRLFSSVLAARRRSGDPGWLWAETSAWVRRERDAVRTRRRSGAPFEVQEAARSRTAWWSASAAHWGLSGAEWHCHRARPYSSPKRPLHSHVRHRRSRVSGSLGVR